MWFSSVLHRLKGTSKSSPRGCPGPGPKRRPRPAVEDLESRLTPAEVGFNDFRLSFMGNDGDPNFGAFDPAVACNTLNNEYLVVWSGDDFTDGEFEIFGQRLDASPAAALGGKIRISDLGPDGDTNFGAHGPAVAYNPTNNEYLVVWYGDDNTAPLVNGDLEIWGQRLNAATGAEVGTNDFRISGIGPNGDPRFQAFSPAVAYNPTRNEYLVVWSGDSNVLGMVDEEFEIFGQRLNASTGAGIDSVRLSDMGPGGNANFDAFFPAVAYNGAANEYLVVWSGDDTTDNEFEIFGQRLDASKAFQVGANDFRISDVGPDGDTRFSAGFYSAVAYNGAANEYLVVWSGDDNTGTLVDNESEVFGKRLRWERGRVGAKST